MPGKIDWELKAKRQSIYKTLNKENAIINAIRDKDIIKAEILSGKDLVDRDPIQEALKRKDDERLEDGRVEGRRNHEEIVNQLRAILDKPEFDYDKFVEAFRRMQAVERVRQEAIQTPLPDSEDSEIDDDETSKGATGGLNIDIDKGLDEDLTKKYGKPSEFLKKGDRIAINEIREKLLNKIREYNLKSYPTAHVSRYRNRLKDVLRAMDVQEGSGIITNLADLRERMKLIIGSIEAGNSSKDLKNELSEILYYLYKNRKINKNVYESLINLTN